MLDNGVDHLGLFHLGFGIDITFQIHGNRDAESLISNVIVAASSSSAQDIFF